MLRVWNRKYLFLISFGQTERSNRCSNKSSPWFRAIADAMNVRYKNFNKDLVKSVEVSAARVEKKTHIFSFPETKL